MKMKISKTKMIGILILIYAVLLWDCNISYTYKKSSWQIQYKGLIWVALDYYTIIKYESNDQPMKWLAIKEIESDNGDN